ncbi:MAG TPA: hypothetical protein PKA42_03290 [Candidatus Paceibacterota bacterium]|nr:hypothetical protein [Candidatus Paceibacterota bacterium]HMO83166.1 hypothetical protein [Candidatus Paceibacterota bacterium]
MAVTSITAAPSDTAYGQIVSIAATEKQTPVQSLDTERIVRSYFKDIPVMIEVARCESTFRHTLGDGSVLKGVVDPADTGVMQINKRYHEKTAIAMSLNLEDIYHNMAYARHLYEKQGTQPWSASAPCWSRTLAANI